MKILHIITGLNDGGAEGALFRLCKNDIHNSHYILTLIAGGKYVPKFETLKIPTYSLSFNSIKGVLTSFFLFKKILKDINPDVIQTWLYHADFIGGIFSYALGYKNIFWNIRNCNTGKKALKSSTRLIVYINSIISSFIPKRIVSVSEISTLHHIKIGYQKNKFINISNGYEFNHTDIICDELLQIKQQSRFLIGMVARYDAQKDHSTLLKSISILKDNNIDFNLLLVGTGMDSENVKLVAEINKLKLNKYVTLLGRRDDIDSVMQVLDLHVLSSLGEAFPNVLVEAMSNGTLCVSTNVGDSSFIINGNGWVVESGSPKELALAIIDAYNLFQNNKDSWTKLRVSAKDSVSSRFSIEKMVNKYNEIWSDR